MAQDSAIEWTDATWNPVTGCTKISPGCKNCYAHRMARRLHAMGQARYRNNFAVTLQPDVLDQPLRWSQPRRIFVNSMSDLFHPDVPLEFIRRVFNVMGKADWHTFQILTKRSERLVELAGKLPWHNNVWMGVSVENADYTYRIEHLRKVPASVRFPISRAVVRTYFLDCHSRNSLGDSRWRVRSWSAQYGPTVGEKNQGPMHRSRRSVFLQTVGWNEKEANRSRTGRQNVG